MHRQQVHQPLTETLEEHSVLDHLRPIGARGVAAGIV
jgi:hypothetical protein